MVRDLSGKYDLDMIYGAETQTDWRFAKVTDSFANLLFQGEDRRSVVGFNIAEDKMSRHQEGETAMVVTGFKGIDRSFAAEIGRIFCLV